MKLFYSLGASAALVLASSMASAATINFNNGSGTYSAGGVTATVAVTTNRSQDGLYYNGVENAIGIGNSATTGAIGYSHYAFPIGKYVENETMTVSFDQEITLDNVWLRQWENNFLGFGDEVNLSYSGGSSGTGTLNFDLSDQTSGLLDRFGAGGISLTQFTLTPEQDGTNGAGATVRTAVYLHSVDFEVSQVPLPAAVWLFGSALFGLVGVSRRRKTAA
jgi:hypothetical protein